VRLNKVFHEPIKANQLVQPMLIELSPKAIANLEKLQLNSLDKQGRQPAASEVIERLINAAAVNRPDAPYPP
jgi:hypothetical protein